MKFLIDASLPRRMAHWLRSSGHDAKHTLDLPDGNRTKDADVVAFTDRMEHVVVTKDSDFVVGHVLHKRPN